MKALGLLAGVGSLLREASDAGFEILGNLETRSQYHTARHLSWDLNFPDVPLIRDPAKLTRHSDIDLIIGHPPCGSHSHLGNSGAPKQSLTNSLASERAEWRRKRHAKTGLLPLYIEQVNLLQPKMFALDTLPKFMETSAPPEWWKAQLPKYRLTFIVMKNWDYGTPQVRKRLWVVGARKPLPAFVLRETLRRQPGPRTAREAFEGLAWEPWLNDPELAHVHVSPDAMLTGDYRTTIPGLSVKEVTQLGLGFLSIRPNQLWPYTTASGRLARKIGRTRLPFESVSRTITGLPSIHHPMTGWPLTPRERARLMQWPDDFQLGDATTLYDRYALMRLTLFTGKAVPSGFPRYLIPQLARHMSR